jgi:hypothetical protein
MDRTNAIARLNTEEIVNEVNNVIKKGLDKLLGDHLYRYELLERTHDAIMNLPSVRNHLNQNPYDTTQTDIVKQHNYDTKAKNDLDKMMKYELLIENLSNKVVELTNEINKLKSRNVKDDLKPQDEDHDEQIVVVKLEQRENIKLEIEENICNDDTSSEEEEEDNVSESEEQEESEDASVANIEEDEVEEDEVEEDEVEEDEVEEDEVEEEEDENICSECDCKVILKEDIVIVDGKKYCGACDPSTVNDNELEEEEVDASEEEEVEVDDDDVETEKSEEEEEEEEYIEIDIDDVTYCTNNEENGFIYEVTEDGDLGDKVGYLKDGEPFFYADEK